MLYYLVFFAISLGLGRVMIIFLNYSITLEKKKSNTSLEMKKINIQFISKFFKSSIIVVLVNLLYDDRQDIFKNGGLVRDLIVINLGKLWFDFLIGFLFDYRYLYKKIKNAILIYMVKNVLYSCFFNS